MQYIFPPHLKTIIRSDPPPVIDDGRYQEFLAQTQPLLNSASSEGFQAAVEPEWSALWNWLRAGLKVLRVYEDQDDHLPMALRNTIISSVAPILLVLSEVIAGFHSNSATMILETHELKELIALCVAVALVEPDNMIPDDNTYQQCVVFIVHGIRCADKRSLGGFVKALEAASLSVFGTSLTDTWKNCLELQLIHPTYTSIQGHRLYLFLLLVTLPHNEIHSRLDTARSVWPCVYRVWRILTSSKVSIVGSAGYHSPLLRLHCITSLLLCHNMWISGGPLWVVAALDHRCLPMVYRTCRFLRHWNSAYLGLSSAYKDVIDMLQILVSRVLRFWIFHDVGRRAQYSLSKAHSRDLPLGSTPTEASLQAAWGQAIDTFCAPAMISVRRLLWRLTCTNACEQCNGQFAIVDSSTRSAARRCSGCKVVAYCSKTCQIAHHREGHKTKCKELTRKRNGHPIYGDCGDWQWSDIPSLEKYYVYGYVISRLNQLMPRIWALIDGHSETSAVIVDFSKSRAGTMALLPKQKVVEQLCLDFQSLAEHNNGFNLVCGRILVDLETSMLIPYIC